MFGFVEDNSIEISNINFKPKEFIDTYRLIEILIYINCPIG